MKLFNVSSLSFASFLLCSRSLFASSVLFIFGVFNASRPSDFSYWANIIAFAAVLVLAVLNIKTLFERKKNKIDVPYRKQLFSWALLCTVAKFSVAMLFAVFIRDSSIVSQAYILCFVAIDSLFFELLGALGTRLKFRHVLLIFGVFFLSILYSFLISGFKNGFGSVIVIVVSLIYLGAMIFSSSLVSYWMAKLLMRFVFKPLKDAKEDEDKKAKNPVYIKGKFFRSNATKIEKGMITAEPETIRGKRSLKQKIAKATLKVVGDNKKEKKKCR